MSDERRRPRRDAPAADQVETNKNVETFLPAVPRRGPEAGNPQNFVIMLLPENLTPMIYTAILRRLFLIR